MDLFLSLISSTLGIMTSFIAVKNEQKRIRIFFIFSTIIFIILLSVTTMIAIENKKLKSPQTKIEVFLNQWEEKDVNFVSNGELKGAMIEGMFILESVKTSYPENYNKAFDLVYKGHDPRIDTEFWNERDKLEEGFEAVRIIIKGLEIILK